MSIHMLQDGELADMALEMAVMADAGLDFHQIVTSMASGFHDRRADMLRTAAGMLSSGKTYPDEALAVSGLFPKYFTDMLGVGCTTGKVPECLRALHSYYLRSYRLKQKIRDGARQPLGMLLVSIAVFLVMIVKVLPIFSEAYRSAGMMLSPGMERLVQFGQGLSAGWKWWAAGAAVVAIGALCIAMTGLARKTAAKLTAGSRTGRAVRNARFVQALSMGLDSGMEQSEAVSMACDVAGGEERFLACAEQCAGETPLSEALSMQEIVSRAHCQMLRAGEEAGALPDTMAYVAGAMTDSTERRIEKLSGLVEPVVTLLGAALTGGVIILAMLPLLDVMQAIG